MKKVFVGILLIIAFIAGMACMFLIIYIIAKLVLWDDSVDFYGDEKEDEQ